MKWTRGMRLWIAVPVALATLAQADDLSSLKARYEKANTEVILDHGTKIGDLNTQYVAALEALLVRVKKAGDLDKTTAVMAEVKRFGETKAMPAEPAAMAELQPVQVTYDERLTVLEAGKSRRIALLAEQYDAELETLQKKLVTGDKLDDARAVQGERANIATNDLVVAARAYVASLVPAPTPMKPPSGSTTNGVHPRMPPRGDIVGIWEYETKGHVYRREFTADKKCILSRNGKLMWERPYKRMSSTKAYVLSSDGEKAYHTVESDGTLNIEDVFIGRRVEQ